MWPDDDSDLPVELWAAFGADPAGDPGGWTFTNLTDRLLDNPIPIRRGATAGGTVSASSATLHLLNDDGALTPLYAPSIYYPKVVLGTPIWVPLRRAEDSFGRTMSNGWGAADSGQTWTAWNGSLSDYSTNGTAGRHSHGTINFLRRSALDVDLLDVHQTVDVSTSALVTGAAMVTGLIARYVSANEDYYWCRTEFNAGGTTVMLKITRVRGGVHTELAALNPVPGLAYAATTPLRTKVSIVGDELGMKVWTASGTEPVGWHLEVTDPDPLTAPGQTGVQSWVVSGNTNSPALVASFDNYAARVDLMTGFADSWVPTFVPTADGDVASIVRVTASGILRRLGQGDVPRSALARFLPGTGPVAYWPLEDGTDATQAASGLLGGEPMTVKAGIMDFTDDAPPGSAGSAHPNPNASNALTGSISGASATGWQISVWTKGIVQDTGIAAYYAGWEIVTTTGQVLRLAMQYDIDEAIAVGHWTSITENIFTNVIFLDDPEPRSNPGITGEWIHVTFSIEQSGADCFVYLNVNEVQVESAVWPGLTVGAPRDIVAISPFGNGQPTSDNMRDIYLSQLTIHNGVALVPQQHAGLGFPGELASERAERIGVERNLPIYVHPGESEALGPQPVGSDLDILRDIEKVDGILYERGWGLGWRPNSTRYNQPYGLTVDLDTYQHSSEIRPDQVVAPVYDDQGTRNDVTVSRRDGSSARFIDSDHADRHGVYDDSVELGVATDDVLINHAAWRVHLGTWEEMRYPGIPVDLAGNPELIDAWLNLTVGDRVRQTSIPAPHPPDDVDQLASGFSQTLTRRGAWSGTIVGTPARPWDVATADGEQRVPADGSTLAAALTDVGTSLLLASTVANGPWWVGDATSQPDDFPLDVRVGGEVVTVSEIEPSVTDAFARTVSNGWGSADTGHVWTASGGAASDYSVSGGTGRHSNTDVNNQRRVKLDIGHTDWDYTVDVLLPMTNANTAPVTVWLAGRLADDSNHYLAVLSLSTGGIMSLRLDKRVGGALTNVSPPATVASNTSGDRWRVRFRGSGSTLWATAENVTAGSDPVSVGGTDTSLTAGTQIGILTRLESGNTNTLPVLIQFDNLTVNSPQLVTLSARGVNGVQRAWAAGMPIDVAEPAIAAL